MSRTKLESIEETLDAILEIADDWRCDNVKSERALDEIRNVIAWWDHCEEELDAAREREKLRYCRHEGEYTWIEYDARGIPIGKVCELCVEVHKAKYRPEVLSDPNYDPMGEMIEEDV